MVELNILSEVEQAEEPKQQEDRQPKREAFPNRRTQQAISGPKQQRRRSRQHRKIRRAKPEPQQTAEPQQTLGL